MISEELIIKLCLRGRDKLANEQETVISSMRDGDKEEPLFYIDLALITDFPTLQVYKFQHVDVTRFGKRHPFPDNYDIILGRDCLHVADLLFEHEGRFILRIENTDEKLL